MFIIGQKLHSYDFDQTRLELKIDLYEDKNSFTSLRFARIPILTTSLNIYLKMQNFYNFLYHPGWPKMIVNRSTWNGFGCYCLRWKQVSILSNYLVAKREVGGFYYKILPEEFSYHYPVRWWDNQKDVDSLASICHVF
jgi:hypothetical protein